VWTQYAAIDAKYASDTIHESWNWRWLFSTYRTIGAGGALANSVSIRCRRDPGYHPSNLRLTLQDGVPIGYQSVEVVAEGAGA
jgi:hypothetical protein